VFTGDIVVCHFIFHASRNKLAESFVYHYGNADIQSNYNTFSVIPHHQQNGSQQGTQTVVSDILPVDTYGSGFFCRHRHRFHVQRSGYNAIVFNDIDQRNAVRTAVYHLTQTYFFAHGWFSCSRKCRVFVFDCRRRRNADADKYGNPY
jgi:hypothetical protein